MLRVNIQNDHLGRVTVKERNVLDDFTLDRASRFTEETVGHKRLVRVDLLRDRGCGLSRIVSTEGRGGNKLRMTYIKRLTRKEDNFVKL